MAETWTHEEWTNDFWYRGKVSRRRLLGFGAAATGALGAAMLVPSNTANGAPAIGTLQPLSGTAAAGGKTALVGVQMAVDRINKTGGINGRPVELLIGDYESKPDVGRRKAEKLVVEDKIDAHVGGYLSNVCLACMPVYEEHRIVNMVSVCLDTTITTTKCSRYTFRPFDYAPAQAVAFAPYLVNKMGKKWHIAYLDYAWGQSTRDAYAEQIKKHISEVGRAKETVYAIYVLDPSDERLETVISLREVMLASPGQTAAEMAEGRRPVSVGPLVDREDVARLISKYNLVALPVLDDKGHIVGNVTVDDVIDVLVEEQTEDLLRMAGVEPGALDKPYFDNPILRVVRKRIGWLLLVAGAWVGFKAISETVESSASIYSDPTRVQILLDLDVDVNAFLPPDTLSAGYDNIADVQTFSPTLMESYLRAASQISRLAVGDRIAMLYEGRIRQVDPPERLEDDQRARHAAGAR